MRKSKRSAYKHLSLCLFGALLLSVAGCSRKEPVVAPKDRILMANDILYYGTEETGPMGDADCVKGEILSTVQPGEIPTENGQSNFGGVGNPYTFDFGDGGIMVFVEEEYFWFYREEKGAQTAVEEGQQQAVKEGEQQAEEEREQEEEETMIVEPLESLDPSLLPLNFVFSSGAGAWGTMISLEKDGSFTGGYNDSDMGDTGEGYAHGKHYHCTFQGRFGNFQKVDEYTYGMTLEEIRYEPEPGTEEIRDEILYIGSEPYGLSEGKEFLLYLPETPAEGLTEEFLSWWPGRYTWDGKTGRALGCYGIRNVEMEYGFFSDDVCPDCRGPVSPQTGVCGECGKAVGN